jgi:hypothetical protein
VVIADKHAVVHRPILSVIILLLFQKNWHFQSSDSTKTSSSHTSDKRMDEAAQRKARLQAMRERAAAAATGPGQAQQQSAAPAVPAPMTVMGGMGGSGVMGGGYGGLLHAPAVTSQASWGVQVIGQPFAHMHVWPMYITHTCPLYKHQEQNNIAQTRLSASPCHVYTFVYKNSIQMPFRKTRFLEKCTSILSFRTIKIYSEPISLAPCTYAHTCILAWNFHAISHTFLQNPSISIVR